MQHDIYICGMYIWPEESPMYNICDVDLFDVVLNDVYEFENKGSVYLIGDLNSRVGSLRIQTGRYGNDRLPRNERICVYCDCV